MHVCMWIDFARYYFFFIELCMYGLLCYCLIWLARVGVSSFGLSFCMSVCVSLVTYFFSSFLMYVWFLHCMFSYCMSLFLYVFSYVCISFVRRVVLSSVSYLCVARDVARPLFLYVCISLVCYVWVALCR